MTIDEIREKYLKEEDKRKFNVEANNISSIGTRIYILILLIIEYIRTDEIPYTLFSIFFIAELIKSVYKYIKSKEKLYLFEAIGCATGVISLIVLMV